MLVGDLGTGDLCCELLSCVFATLAAISFATFVQNRLAYDNVAFSHTRASS
jgi:hypothetical protein